MSDASDLDRAKREADASRDRLLGSAHALQSRLSPTNIAENAIDGVRTRGIAAGRAALGLAKRQPIAAAAAAIGVVALIARKPIAGLIRRFRKTD